MKARSAPEQRLKRRLAGSFAVALLLHGLASWFLWVRRTVETPQTTSRKLTVELVQRPTPALPAPPTPSKEKRRRRAPESTPTETAAKDATPKTPAPNSLPVPPPAPPPRVVAAEPSKGSAPSEVHLFDPGALARAAERGKVKPPVGQTVVDDGDNSPAGEISRVRRRVETEVAANQAHERVASGLVDPYFGTISKSVREAWKPKPGQLGGADGDGVKAGFTNLVQGWGAVGKQWAKSGSPYADGEAPAGIDTSRPVARPTDGTSGFDPADFAARWNNGEFAFKGGFALLELTQDGQGHTLTVRILQSSGFKLFDEAAKSAVADAANENTPPAHGLGLGGDRILSVWKLQAKIVPNTCSLIPDSTGATKGAGVMPGLACGGVFDPSLGVAEFREPLKTRVVTTVELIAVYGGENGPH